ncbi:MAG TPA: Rne/Rng family ribonuclease, partial [Xanthobacteraceae bacterium]
MANKMLIDATHPEETRVVVLRGNRVEEFDFESANRKQLRGNIYLAKVTRVEPSLQAAFVDYGGNRHGFLAFSEIHPDYYQIPVADRQALIDEEERAHRDAEAEADRRAGGGGGGGAGGGRRHHRPHQRSAERPRDVVQSEPLDGETIEGDAGHQDTSGTGHESAAVESADTHADTGADRAAEPTGQSDQPFGEPERAAPVEAAPAEAAEDHSDDTHEPSEGTGDHHPDDAPSATSADAANASENGGYHDHRDGDGESNGHESNGHESNGHGDASGGGDGEEEEIVESVGGADAMEEVPDRMPRLRRQYKIQEVIKRRQIMLVQVVKEERGTKGAALTTYLSLAGRYSVLMPNTARGGGISRKITAFQDRKRLKEVAQELEVPEGMGVILRTAGANRTKTEIKRDFEYLLRMWETVRDVTLNSTAPTLVYEEGSLVKRSIRDLYNKDIDEVVVAGEAYGEARDFMRMLMPSHAKNVKPYRESQPILTRYGIESQLDAMFSPVVQLRSGGYIVINQTEALVAIDVNSGRATREHHIEDTALKTNIEASEEIARQLRLRDLAGLIVIDFIDMDEKRNNRSVERRLKESLKHDRARIQVGRISHFGLMEMSRQRIRTSVLESSTDKCPHCGGTGHVRSVASVALQVLRMIEETLLRGATHNLVIRTRSDIAIYVLNHKRAHLRELEERFRITITINADAAMGGQTPFMIERGEQVHTAEQARAIAAALPTPPPIIEPEEDEEAVFEDEEADEGQADEDEASEGDEHGEAEAAEDDGEPGERENGERTGERDAGDSPDGVRRRRRRRRRGRRGEPREGGAFTSETVPEHAVAHEDHAFTDDEEAGETHEGPAREPREREPREHEPREGEPREAQPHANGGGDAESELRRRRRRGRRGGRRNRRDREGEERFGPDATQSGSEHGPIEPELADAVADFGGPPVAHESGERTEHAAPRMSEPAPHESAPHEFAPHDPMPRESEFSHAGPPAAEPPRRKSTVREPVPFPIDDEAP